MRPLSARARAADRCVLARRQDLAHHGGEIAADETNNYAVLDEGETELLGCVYTDPPDKRSPGASTWRSSRGSH